MLRTVAITCLAALALMGCSMPTPVSNVSAEDLAGTGWELQHWQQRNGGAYPLMPGGNGGPISIRFSRDGAANILSGSAGCNRYRGGYTLGGGYLQVLPAATTRMACLSPERAKLEQDYLNVLTNATTLTRDRDPGRDLDTLTLASSEGDELLFVRVLGGEAPEPGSVGNTVGGVPAQ
ncbi:META domain-containing protein [Nitrospirillum sp. BR 11164]|uniref:META domain-containing protein n=1 Tax=Nitrospirillum sp. BR 11164 TaxID=3104324 RepID=UPI002AFF5E7D|nr:META domain-containing protein [Nitrospirillum sp. BR 11164]MEA1651755.1 META domain-containing protein [Nitrospirillum sp. BR 11164]